MPRPAKKADDKAKVPGAAAPVPTMVPPPTAGVIPPSPVPVPAQMAMPTRVVDTDSFMRVRDSVSWAFFIYSCIFPVGCASRRAPVVLFSLWCEGPTEAMVGPRHS